MHINTELEASQFKTDLDRFFQLAETKVQLIDDEYDTNQGSPVFTVKGKYSTRGWTEWTQGFQYGIPLLLFDAIGNEEMLKAGRTNTRKYMAHHLSHFGVHDHGFNNISTYGNLLRLSNLNQFDCSEAETEYYELALKLSAAVQAKRWTSLGDGGFIYSFNGPHSLFIDTMRTTRILMSGHVLGHKMLDEHDEVINLLERALQHGLTSAKYNVYYGEGRDQYDAWGRTAHECIFNLNDGRYRCSNAQQGFSGFTTWTRGLAWAMLGYSESLEFLRSYSNNSGSVPEYVWDEYEKAAKATCDFYIKNSAKDGIPYWDTGAPNLHRLGDYTLEDSLPNNDWEPVDSSAAAIGAQGLIRLGMYLKDDDPQNADRYLKAGLTILKTLLSKAYLSNEDWHQGILLHSIYHQPNGWDYVPEGSKIANGESSMWGDYHMTELCLLVWKMAHSKYYSFYETLLE